MPVDAPSELNGFCHTHIRVLRESLRLLAGHELVHASDDDAAALALWEAPFVLLSHDTQADPVFTYGNRKALHLFELTWEQLTSLPSRLSAEAPDREERARLLAEVTANGFIDDYSGVRISHTGRRFRIERAKVWNLFNKEGAPAGQAAMFSEWAFL